MPFSRCAIPHAGLRASRLALLVVGLTGCHDGSLHGRFERDCSVASCGASADGGAHSESDDSVEGDALRPDVVVDASAARDGAEADATGPVTSPSDASRLRDVDGGDGYWPLPSLSCRPPLGPGADASAGSPSASVGIFFPPEYAYTDADMLTVRGYAADPDGIAAVTVNGIAATSSDSFGSWTARVPVSQSCNMLRVAATDRLGHDPGTDRRR